MRIVVRKGRELLEVVCSACGQIEMVTDDEPLVCPNCGGKMHYGPDKAEEEEAPEDASKDPDPEDPLSPGKVVELPDGVKTPEEPVPAAQEKKKRGRPPKCNKRVCRNCGMGFPSGAGPKVSCKVDLTVKDPDDTCDFWEEGR